MDENSRVLTGEYNSISQALSTLVEQYLDKPHCLAFPNIKTFPQDKVSPETSNDGIINIMWSRYVGRGFYPLFPQKLPNDIYLIIMKL